MRGGGALARIRTLLTGDIVGRVADGDAKRPGDAGAEMACELTPLSPGVADIDTYPAFPSCTGARHEGAGSKTEELMAGITSMDGNDAETVLWALPRGLELPNLCVLASLGVFPDEILAGETVLAIRP